MLIIFMDDDEGTRMIAPNLFKRHGHKLIVTADATEAMIAMTNSRADAAILDVQGKDKDTGVQVARAMQRMNPKIKIILVSGAPCPTNEFDFMSKPYEIEDVLHALGA